MRKGAKQRIAALLLAAVLLAGCSGPQDAGSASNSDNPAGFTQESGTMVPLYSLSTYWAASPEGAYIQLSWPKNGGYIIQYIDYATRTGVPLCSQANCAHNSDSCTAWLGDGSDSLFYWQDRLYILDQNHSDTLWEAQPNGQDRRKILELDANQIIMTPILAKGRQLYFTMLEIKENQVNQENQELQYLCRFDLDEGKLTPIHNCMEGGQLLGGWDDTLLLEVTGPVDPSIPNDMAHLEEYFAAERARPHSLYRVSTEGDRESEPILTWTESEMAVGAYGSLLYLHDTKNGSLTVRDLATGSEQQIQDQRLCTERPSNLYIPVADGAIIPVEPEDMSQYPTWYLYSNGQLTASRCQYVGGVEFDAPRNRITADAGEYYLVERNFDSPDYALVPKADYWADSDGATDIPIQMQLPW